MTLKGVMAVILRYSTEFSKLDNTRKHQSIQAIKYRTISFWKSVTRVHDNVQFIYQTAQYFIWSKCGVVHFVTVKYSLH